MSCTASVKETTATTGLLINRKEKTVVIQLVVDSQNFFSNVLIGAGLSIWDRDGDEFHEIK
jgi:hypothetical protein